MGMAASQARYLALTARKSNVEFQGQQINQQRTALAVQQTEYFNELVTLKNPTVPVQTDYVKGVYTNQHDDGAGNMLTYIIDMDSIKEGSPATAKMHWTDKDGIYYETTVTGTFIKSGSGNLYTAFIPDKDIPGTTYKKDDNISLISGSWEDEKAYNDAMAKFNQDKMIYDKRIEEINAKTRELQIQDRTLELKLRNLDTEQNAIQTELESVKKVIQDTIEKVFKTFQS